MATITTLYDRNEKRWLKLTHSGNSEYANPKIVFLNISFNASMCMYVDFLIRIQEMGLISKELSEEKEDKIFEYFKNESIVESKKDIQFIYSKILPESIFDIFKTDIKKKHEKALKDIHLTMDHLLGFYFKAFDNYNCIYSKYLFIHENSAIDKIKMPQGAIIEKDGSITKYGETDLSDGQIRQAIQHRKCIRVDILDNEEKWYCFYWTWKSISGQESSKKFDEHLHYIDFTWGLSRQHVLKKLNSKYYALNGIHINFHEESDEKVKNFGN